MRNMLELFHLMLSSGTLGFPTYFENMQVSWIRDNALVQKMLP